MAYSVPNIGFARERNLAGGIGTGITGPISITGPDIIQGTSVTVSWDQNGVVADTFRITIGLTQTDSQIADSGEIPAGGSGDLHYWTFKNLTYPTHYVWITVRHRFGGGSWNGVQRKLKVDYDGGTVDPDPNLNWLDSTIWDDDEAWTE